MKRILSLALALLLLLSLPVMLGSCNKPEPTDNEWKYKYLTFESGFIIAHNIDNTSPNVGCYDALLINCDTEYDKGPTEIYKVNGVLTGTIYVCKYYDETEIVLETFDSLGYPPKKKLSNISISESNTDLTDEWASITSIDMTGVPEEWRYDYYYDKSEVLKYLKN